ncbi:hypothetical protein PsYK624_013320 [Phanerochaete sordida]|uniref:Uncharacterized protein n=1 Tax=Phanerochaete sordida TaxID=48140 RepID=A0A9P3L884_9APHY|nr:hypothetical protein PsYK624_013320 [Phanerochaete sordida]
MRPVCPETPTATQLCPERLALLSGPEDGLYGLSGSPKLSLTTPKSLLNVADSPRSTLSIDRLCLRAPATLQRPPFRPRTLKYLVPVEPQSCVSLEHPWLCPLLSVARCRLTRSRAGLSLPLKDRSILPPFRTRHLSWGQRRSRCRKRGEI